MTDRGTQALHQTADTLRVGPSQMHWTGTQLIIDINEWGALPMVTPVRGRIIVTPQAVTAAEVALTPDNAHIWRPFAPTSHIDVDMSQGNRWQGHGYFDANFGTRALEDDFDFWTWGRYPMKDRALCIYDATRRDGSTLDLSVEITPDGQVREVSAPPRTEFAKSLWQVRRETRADPGTSPKQQLSMLDAPFYARSLVQTRIDGEETTGVHEALDLSRFRQPVVKAMLAFRVPRRAGWPKDAARG